MEPEVHREIKYTENTMKLQAKRTDLSKHSFIEEIKRGLGDEIKQELTKKAIKPKERGFKGFIRKLIKMF